MTSPDSPSLSTEIDMDRVLKRLAHGGGPFDFDDDVQIINWLANRELFRRAPALSEGEPTPDALLDLLDELQNAAKDFDHHCCQRGNCPHENREVAARIAVLEHVYLRGQPVSPSLSTSSPELTKLLDELCLCVGQFEKVSFDWACEEAETYQMENAQKAINAARSAIELSFATLTEEIKRLRTESTATSFLVTATEKSTTRTESPAPEEIAAEKLRAYAANFGEKRRGVMGVVLPLGSIEGIERLSRDLIAFGYGMGDSVARSLVATEQLRWYDKAEAARLALMENVRATALTPEEASYLEDDVHLSHQFVCGFWHDEACNCLLGTISDKLRSLSGETPK